MAEKDLEGLDNKTRTRIITKLDWLSKNFDSIIPSVLHAEYREFYKLRVGEWRIVYKTDWAKKVIVVHYIDKRDKIYKIK
ncbi:MAG TPA: type II toxin-antitoxin system RelE/ParE family toxin [Candidatus Paceibacterota bacterium]|nr:type II toxin-antitoxin system RelE/ParE family toxin [Candidatus Paceibacterota bacterium]